MTGFMHIGFGIVLTTLTNVYSSIFITGEIPFLGGVSVRSMGVGGCLPAPPLPLEMGKLGGGVLYGSGDTGLSAPLPSPAAVHHLRLPVHWGREESHGVCGECLSAPRPLPGPQI